MAPAKRRAEPGPIVPAPEVSEFLSTGWFKSLGVALERLDMSGSPAIAIGQIVTGVPTSAGAGADICYTIVLGGSQSAHVTVGSTESADVVLLVAYRDALAIASGQRTGGSLLAAGAVKIRGDAARLVEAVALLEATTVPVTAE